MLVSRRSFLVAGGATGLLVVTTGHARAGSAALPADPFRLGVASGEPDATSVVLWTRLAPEPLALDGGMPPAAFAVDWELAADEAFADVVRSGTATAHPDDGHSVHVEVAGLRPRTTYWYRFRAGDATSAVGRTRTFPQPADASTFLAFGVVGCQSWEQGYYAAYANMADDDLDFVLHTGDYIYESTTRGGELSEENSGRVVRDHVGPEPVDLAGYRRRHAQYKTDPHLQTCHARFPWLVTWDDHGVVNNYAGGAQDAAGLARRAAAYRAYWENMPLREAARPAGPSLQLFRGVPFGRLADISILDTRQYRSRQPCDGRQVQDIGACDEQFEPDRVLLGTTQEAWLHERLRTSAATWNVVAQQVIMAGFDYNPVPGNDQPIVNAFYNVDSWDSAFVERQRLLDVFADSRVRNPVVLTGDVHSGWCNDLLAVPYEDSPVVGTEFVGTSISSIGVPTPVNAQALADNPHVKFYEGEFRGYLRCTVTPEQWVTELRTVPTARTDAEPAVTLATFTVEEGNPGADVALGAVAVPARPAAPTPAPSPGAGETGVIAPGAAPVVGSPSALPATGAAMPLAAATAAVVVGSAIRRVTHPGARTADRDAEGRSGPAAVTDRAVSGADDARRRSR